MLNSIQFKNTFQHMLKRYVATHLKGEEIVYFLLMAILLTLILLKLRCNTCFQHLRLRFQSDYLQKKNKN